MERREYSAGAVKWSFWFLEFKKVVLLLAQGMSIEEIRKKNAEENLFSASTADSDVRMFFKEKQEQSEKAAVFEEEFGKPWKSSEPFRLYPGYHYGSCSGN